VGHLTAEAGPGSTRGEAFSDRVLVLFLTQVLTAGLGVFNGFFLASLIGPSGKGDYYLLTFLPPTLMVLSQLGLPQAFTYFSARGMVHRIILRTLILTGSISVPVLIATVALLPVLRATVLHGLDPVAIVVPLVALPFLINATYTTGILVGRQAVRKMALVSICVSVSATSLILLLAGSLGLGLWGALIAFILTAAIQAVGFLVGATRTTRAVSETGSASYRDLLRYGIPAFPGNLTQFFAYRADVYLLAWLLADPSAPLGYYSMAVSMAELVFFFPNAVSTLFFPHVAGASREDSSRQVPLVSRVTLLLTAAVGLALVPVATVAIRVLLPAFEPSLPALYILLPGVVSMSVTKVLSGYVYGLGRTGLTSLVSILAFTLNVILNLFMIPLYGIVGAAAASFVSYTLTSMAYSVIVAYLTGGRATDFWIPRAADFRFAFVTLTGLVRRIAERIARPG
jgi:O-antigen/teichoic acid export membrane protein